MDDLKHGTRNRRGDWTPNDRLETAPLFEFPPRWRKLLAWLPSYFVPWNVIFLSLALLFWWALTPDKEVMQELSPGWILYLLARNSLLVLVIYGAIELRLYIKRTQGARFKYNQRFPADTTSGVFWFKSQNIDNALRTFGSGLPIWTMYEALILWCYANDFGLWATFGDNPIWLIAFALVLPLVHEFHFYCIHRLIHVPVLYKHVHSVHHNSVNPSPWSSLSMHPVEHLLYWSGTLIHIVLPSLPLLLLYHLQISGTGAVIGHVGFDQVEVDDEKAIGTHAFAHYLHHKYFEVNYADGTIPLDRWFGTWHDGSAEAGERMRERMKQRRRKMAAKAAKGSSGS